MSNIIIELAKLSVTPVLTLVFTAFIGLKLTSTWNEKQKRRELELALAGSFYGSYGEFCAVWKEWNWYHSYIRENNREEFQAKKRIFLERACRAEGNLEAVLLKIASERKLSSEQSSTLGLLRQAYQVLREQIQADKKISYGSSEHVDYLEFKRLSTFVGSMLVERPSLVPTASEAFASFREITSNRHEARWARIGQ